MAEIQEIIKYNWMQISVITYMAIMLIYGYYKGFVKMSSHIVSIVISVVITKMIKPYVLNWITSNKNIRNYLNLIVQNIVSENISNVSESTGIPQTIENDSIIGTMLGIDSKNLNLNSQSIYDMIGLDKIANVIAEKVTELLLSVITFILLLIIVTVIVKCLFKILDKVASLPVLTVFNKISGSILGLIESILYIWIIFIVLNILPKGALVLSALEQINRPNSILYVLKENNIFIKVFELMLR